MRGHCLKVSQGKYRMDIRRTLFTERMIRHRNEVLREIVESPSLEGVEGKARWGPQ